MMRSASVVVMMMLAASAKAAPGSRLVMKQTMDASIHLADQAGAITTSREAAIVVELGAKNTAHVVGTGRTADHNLFSEPGARAWTTQEVTSWTTTWKGTFTRAQDTLVLDLALVRHACTHTKSTSGAPDEVLACATPTSRVQISCARGPVELEARSAKARAAKVSAWTCTPDDGGELAENASTWLLGIGTCIEEAGGHPGPTVRRRCGS